MPYVPHTPEEVRAMLDVIGVSSVGDLFAEIPPELRPKSFDLPQGLSEMHTRMRLEELAGRNRTDFVSFLGAGYYDHYVPSAVDALISRGEFYTAYTPYQPEASQGTLQAIFEYQTAMTRLTGLDCSNASVYDGGTAIYEAVMMAVRHTKRHKVVIPETLEPHLPHTAGHLHQKTSISPLVTVPRDGERTEFAAMAEAVDDQTACVVVQNPNFFGTVLDAGELFARAKAKGAVCLMSVYPVLQSVLKTPAAMGADIAVAEGQSLGLPLSFGGPYLGVMTCAKALVRQMPGRIVGRTVDLEGREGYVLTLQAREQHIRRQKATSNICSNQALCALRALIHLCLLGEEGAQAHGQAFHGKRPRRRGQAGGHRGRRGDEQGPLRQRVRDHPAGRRPRGVPAPHRPGRGSRISPGALLSGHGKRPAGVLHRETLQGPISTFWPPSWRTCYEHRFRQIPGRTRRRVAPRRPGARWPTFCPATCCARPRPDCPSFPNSTWCATSRRLAARTTELTPTSTPWGRAP